MDKKVEKGKNVKSRDEVEHSSELLRNKEKISEIFTKKKAVKKEVEIEAKNKINKRKKSGNPNNVKPKRFDTESGLPVYSEKDLCINRGGKTPLCPFDCDCCF